jgi:hypothetical protein
VNAIIGKTENLERSGALGMSVEVLIDETARVLTRIMPDGEVLPTSFVWRDKTRYVADVGRRWEERIQGQNVRCYLIKAADNNVYELRWNPGADEWTVHRAWLENIA